MNDQALVDLQELGFGEYEARAYVGLLKNGPLNGYQLARVSRVPRPNIYPVLEKLQQRGAVQAVHVKRGLRYVALPSKEMLARLQSSLENRIQRAERDLSRIAEKPASEAVWNIQGYDNVLSRAKALIDGAREKLLVGLWSNEAQLLASALSGAVARNLGITTLCMEGCREECGGCAGHIYRYPLAAEAHSRWLVVAADDRELLLSQVLPDGQAFGVSTTLEVLVAVGGQYLKHSIAAAEIVRSLGSRLPEFLDDRAVDAVRGADLSIDGAAWLDRLFGAIAKAQA